MSSGTTKYLGIAVASGSVSAVVSSLMFLTLGASPIEPPPVSTSTTDLTTVETAINALREDLARIVNRPVAEEEPLSPVTNVIGEGDRRPIVSPPLDLAALHDAIAKLEEIANEAPSAQRIQMLAEMHTLPQLPENWVALVQLASLGDAAERETVNLTFQEVRQRFGTPSKIDPSEQPYVRWTYWQRPGVETGRDAVHFSFLAGRVVTVSFRVRG